MAAPMFPRKTWQEELEIIDRTMRAISSISDPEEFVSAYWDGVGELVAANDFVSLSRRGASHPEYIVTRSSRFTEHPNPWTERHKLPRLRGGLLGEIAYANTPVIIDDLPSRLAADDPGRFYLEGFEQLIALPQYDSGEGLNVSAILFEKGRTVEPRDIPMMHWQAGLFGRGTQNLVLRNQLSAALAALDDELRVVGEIQRSLLPAALPEIDGYDLAAHYQTSARAGGDYYDLFRIDERRVGVLVADVSGHGTPAAVLMAIVRALVHARPRTDDVTCHPCQMLGWLNEQLARSYAHAGAFVTAFVGVLDVPSGELVCASAGHNPPRIVPVAGGVREVRAPAGLPLGIDGGEKYTTMSVKLERGETLLLYTDGITEAMTPVGSAVPPAGSGRGRELFGTSRLDEAAAACRGEHPAVCVAKVVAAVDAFSGGATPSDDRTILAVRRR